MYSLHLYLVSKGKVPRSKSSTTRGQNPVPPSSSRGCPPEPTDTPDVCGAPTPVSPPRHGRPLPTTTTQLLSVSFPSYTIFSILPAPQKDYRTSKEIIEIKTRYNQVTKDLRSVICSTVLLPSQGRVVPSPGDMTIEIIFHQRRTFTFSSFFVVRHSPSPSV